MDKQSEETLVDGLVDTRWTFGLRLLIHDFRDDLSRSPNPSSAKRCVDLPPFRYVATFDASGGWHRGPGRGGLSMLWLLMALQRWAAGLLPSPCHHVMGSAMQSSSCQPHANAVAHDLPHARPVASHLHRIRLANAAIDEVRRVQGLRRAAIRVPDACEDRALQLAWSAQRGRLGSVDDHAPLDLSVGRWAPVEPSG